MLRYAIGGFLAVLACAGTALAVSRPPRPDVGVLVIDTTTGTRERITAADGTAAWSRDGRTIVVSGEGTLTRFAPDGRRIARRALRTPDVAAGDVALSPDERRIAYVAAPGDPSHINTGDLVVSPLDGGRPTVRLTRTRGTPAWSPDGKYLAVERWSESGAHGDGDDRSRVVVIPSDRAGALRNAGAGGQPSWLADGRLLVYDADATTSSSRAPRIGSGGSRWPASTPAPSRGTSRPTARGSRSPRPAATTRPAPDAGRADERALSAAVGRAHERRQLVPRRHATRGRRRRAHPPARSLGNRPGSGTHPDPRPRSC